MYFLIDTGEDKRLRTLLENASRMQGRALGRLAKALYLAGQQVVGAAVKGRFTGQGPFPAAQNKLGVRTGRLRSSIRCTKPQVNLRTGEIGMQFGSNVVYFAIHEFGFNGAVQVRGHTRTRLGGKKFVRGRLTKDYQRRMKARLAGRHFGDTATTTKGREHRGVKWQETSHSLAGVSQVRPHKRKVNVPARAPLGTELKQRTTTLAFMRALRDALEPLMKEK